MTAGPTREYFDTVRFISNSSSGAQAYALAGEFLKRKWKPRIISGPVNIKYPSGCDVISVNSSREMLARVRENLPWADFTVFAAAVCDIMPASFSVKKLKKNKTRPPRLAFSPDIALSVNRTKNAKPSAGFDLEDELNMDEAIDKMRRKKFDIIVQNTRAAMDSPRTTGYLLSKEGALLFSDISKESLAGMLCEEICRIIN